MYNKINIMQLLYCQDEYDEFGDSYRINATLETLEASLKAARRPIQLELDRVDEFMLELSANKYLLFLGKVCKLEYGTEEDKKMLDESVLKFYGGRVIDDMDDSVTHIVLLNPTQDAFLNFKVKADKT